MEVTLTDFFKLLKKTWWIIVIAAVAGAGAAITYSSIIASSNYSSQVVIMVDYKSDQIGENWSAQGDLDYSKSIIRNCITILEQNKFYTTVSNSIKSGDSVYSASKLEKCISYATDSDTSTFTVTVTTNSADTSYTIAVAIEKVIMEGGYIATNYPNFDKENTQIGRINEVLRANKPDDNSNFFIYMIVGAVAAAVAAFFVLLIIDRADVRIKDDKYLTAKYGYPVLGTVPRNDQKKRDEEVNG